MYETRIKQARKQKGISQKMLALKLGTKQTTVSGWENAGSEPAYEQLVKMADLFGVSTDYLLRRTDTPLTLVSSSSVYTEVTPFEREVLERYRAASEETKINICAILRLTHPAELRDRAKRS